MTSIPSVPVGTALLISGAALVIAVIHLAWNLGQLTTEVRETAKMSKQMRTMFDTVEDVSQSVSNIEASITGVDLKYIQDAVERLFEEYIEEGGTQAGNSVEYTLENSGIDVVISLQSIDPNKTKLTIRAQEDISAGEIGENLLKDKELMAKTDSLFGDIHDIGYRTPSPRQINLEIGSSDIESIARWMSYVVKKVDELYVTIHESEDRFDEILEDELGLED